MCWTDYNRIAFTVFEWDLMMIQQCFLFTFLSRILELIESVISMIIRLLKTEEMSEKLIRHNAFVWTHNNFLSWQKWMLLSFCILRDVLLIINSHHSEEFRIEFSYLRKRSNWEWHQKKRIIKCQKKKKTAFVPFRGAPRWESRHESPSSPVCFGRDFGFGRNWSWIIGICSCWIKGYLGIAVLYCFYLSVMDGRETCLPSQLNSAFASRSGEFLLLVLIIREYECKLFLRNSLFLAH